MVAIVVAVFVEELEKKEDLGNIARWERKREGKTDI
jgi:hypothetical protein